MSQSPLLACARSISDTLAGVASSEPLFLSTFEKVSLIGQLARARAQLDEVWLRVLAASTDVAEAAGDRDLAAWLRTHEHCDLRAAHGEVGVAVELESHCPQVVAALREGLVSGEHARVIVRALHELPDDLSAEERSRAEKTLLHGAGALTPSELRRVGRRVLELIDPVRFEHAEARALNDKKTRPSGGSRPGSTTRATGPGCSGRNCLRPMRSDSRPTWSPWPNPANRP